jgi:O-antigen/teichoic acid export membrane protein
MNVETRATNQSLEREAPRAQALTTNLYGLADQALISATNFITLLVLARALSAKAFGAFALAYTALIFVNSLQTALVTQPHNVLGATQRGHKYASFTGATIVGQFIFLVPIVFALTLMGIIAAAIQIGGAGLLLAMVPATLAWQLQELVRRILYTEGRLGAALVNDVIAYGGQTFSVAALWYADRLSGPNALYAVAGTSCLGVLIGFGQVRRSVAWTIDQADLRAHWHFGKWLAAAAVGFGLSAPVYLYLAALLLGAAASGELKASQLALGPMNVLLLFLSTTLPIRLSRTLAFAGETAFKRRVRKALIVTAPVVAIYCVLVSIFAKPLLELLYGSRYAHASAVVALYAAYYFLSYLGQMAMSVLSARQLTRAIFLANFVGAASSLLLGWFFISAAGVEGAVVGMIASIVLADLTLANHVFRNAVRPADASAPT